jgi:ATP-dependent RNA helicase DeaD
MEKFKFLGLSEKTLPAIAKKGFTEPSPIQELTIPFLLDKDQDLIAQAQTGTGKTAAFALPILEKIERSSQPQVLILVPTRELAIQVAKEIHSLQGNRGLQIKPIYGGTAITKQFDQLKYGIDIIVGTPGRVLDLLSRKKMNLNHISHAVLDEADEMLNMGFIDDVEEILKQTNIHKRTLLFSATMPPEIIRIAKKYMHKYAVLSVKQQQITTDLTDQFYYRLKEQEKLEVLCRLMDIEKEFYGLVFCRTRGDVDKLTTSLIERGYAADGMHGEITQKLREKVLSKFRQKKINILVATDVAARGMDIPELTHVVNYAMTQHPEAYVHRIGRTGRAGKQGTAISFVTNSDLKALHMVERYTKDSIRQQNIPKVRDIIRYKKARIRDRIHDISESRLDDSFMKMADELLEKNDANKIVAAILQQHYHKDLDKSLYKEIQPVSQETRSKSFRKNKRPHHTGKRVWQNKHPIAKKAVKIYA